MQINDETMLKIFLIYNVYVGFVIEKLGKQNSTIIFLTR